MMSVRWSRITPRALLGLIAALSFAAPVFAQEVTVLCNFEVDWCEALKAAYEKTTGEKAFFIRMTDGESLAQIRAEKANPRADVYHAAESASAKQLASEGLLEAYKSPRIADLHEWAQRIAAGDWLGKGVFYQAALYPYFLGILQSVLKHDLWSIRLIQITLGAISCAWIFVVGRNLFSRDAGIASGLLLACNAPAIFFDGLIEKSALDLFLLSALLFLVFGINHRESWAKWLGAGAVLGLLGLSRENALIIIPVIAL